MGNCIKFKDAYTTFARKFTLTEIVIKVINKKISLLDVEIFHKNNIQQVTLKNETHYSSISSINHENNVTASVFLIELHMWVIASNFENIFKKLKLWLIIAYLFMTTNSWNFSIKQKEDAISYYQQFGVVGFHDILNSEDMKKIHNGINEAIESGDLKYNDDEFESYQNDIIFSHPILEKLVNDERICNITRNLIGNPIELQHSKFAIKPKKNKTSGGIKWHQDFPFFPHTNFDLIACVIHLDDEEIDSGPLKVIPRNTELGLLSHCTDDKFVYHCTEEDKIDEDKSIPLICNAGDITFHHCLTLHSSEPKKNNRDRRLIVFQYRSQDALQLSGAIWKSTGYQVEKNTNAKVRFPNGLIIENRGTGGRLYDIYGKLKPDEQKKSVSISYSD